MQPDLHLPAGLLVQLHPDKVRDRAYAGCIMVVIEAQTWGAQGYIQNIGMLGGVPGHQSVYRANWDEMEPVGMVCWLAGQEQGEARHDDGSNPCAPGI